MRNTRLVGFTKYTVIALCLFTVAIICGSVGAGMIDGEKMDTLTDYMQGFFDSVPKVNMGLALNSLKKYCLIWLGVFISGFFLPGFLLNAYIVAERGYVIGYTIGGFFKVYGAKGILACCSLLPELLFYIPVFVLFSSISLKMSFSRKDDKKIFFKKYIVISLIYLSVFCVVSFFQTFMTTTFMTLISSKM